jgi:hypothetical protein
MWLAPAAVTSLAVRIGVMPTAQQARGSESWWRRFARSRLAEISARDAIPVNMSSIAAGRGPAATSLPSNFRGSVAELSQF